MQHNIVYPDATRPAALCDEIIALLSQLPFVSHIYVFGSLARKESDRWSDMDMLVLTHTDAQFREVWQHLYDAKPVLHHHPFSNVEPAGGHILGNVFADESVFHCLDLNFLTADEHQIPDILERFGHLESVYQNPATVVSQPQEQGDFEQELTPDDKKISTAIHFTKKNVKKVLRGQSVHDDLRKFADSLRRITQEYTVEYEVVGGKVGKVAEMYLQIADAILENE